MSRKYATPFDTLSDGLLTSFWVALSLEYEKLFAKVIFLKNTRDYDIDIEWTRLD